MKKIPINYQPSFYRGYRHFMGDIMIRQTDNLALPSYRLVFQKQIANGEKLKVNYGRRNEHS